VLFDFGNWSLDETTYIMPLVAKLSTLGYCVRDGTISNNKLSEDQKQRKLTKIPQLYEILSYTTYPGGNFLGPFFEFRDYKDFIEKQGFYANIPSTLPETGRKLFAGIICLTLCIILPSRFDINKLATDEFHDLPFWHKAIYFWFACFAVRLTYYVGFTLVEGSVAISGLSYNGSVKQESRWDRTANSDILGVELATNPRD